VTHFIHTYGLWFVFGVVCAESAGLWLPGETALIAAGVYASNGHLSITAVIAVAAAGAIIGDNIGYWLGREGGRCIHRFIPKRLGIGVCHQYRRRAHHFEQPVALPHQYLDFIAQHGDFLFVHCHLILLV